MAAGAAVLSLPSGQRKRGPASFTGWQAKLGRKTAIAANRGGPIALRQGASLSPRDASDKRARRSFLRRRAMTDFGCNGFDVEFAAVKADTRREHSAYRAASCSAQSMFGCN
jgi:hypothetical protein